MKRRILSVLLITFLLFSFSIPSFAASALKLTGATWPEDFEQGEGYSVKGIISSDYNITKVVIGAYNSNGSVGFEFSDTPYSKSFDILDADYSLPFSKLKAGTYTYKVTASDTQSSNIVLLQKTFRVIGQGDNTLKLTNATYPYDYEQGEGYSVKGIISSDYNITKVVIGAYNSNGSVGFEFSDTPYSKSFDISDVDYDLPFSKLKAGTYTYKITVSDTEVSDIVLMQKSFKVIGESLSSTLKISDANYPTVLDPGEGFSVTGTISSNYNITKITFSAYKSNGAKGFEYTVQPGRKSFDISDVDYFLTFSQLGSGSYTYKITASDEKTSNIVLLEKTFSVGTTAPSGDFKKVNWDVVDISYWNSDAISSWSKIASSLDAIILRLGFAYTASKKMEEDDSFSDYYYTAKQYGLPVGVYYFGAATTASEASKEADFVINLLKKYNCKLEMPVYYDLETEDQVDLTQAECTAVARTFCDKLRAAGYFVGIYCNKYFARDELYASKLSDYHFWIAEYNSSCTYDGDYGMWQYTETGWISGLDRVCDKNYCYYDYPSYIKANGLNGFDKPQPTVNPQFSFKTGTNLAVKNQTVILKNDTGLTQNQFISKYISYKDVTVNMSALASNGKVATGTKISASGNGKSFGPYTICLLGDINSDSKINSSDALMVLQHSVGMKKLSGNALTSADLNSDGKVNSTDALQILKISVSG